MAKSTKTVTYTDEVRAAMRHDYLAKADGSDADRKAVVEYYADLVGTSAASVRQVMNRAGYYIKATYKNKAGGAVVKKADLVEKIAAKLNVSSEVIESLEKANFGVLRRILERFASYENDITALRKGMSE